MRKSITLLALCFATNPVWSQMTKQDVVKNIDARYDTYSSKAKEIWNFAEVGFQEYKSSELLQQTLKEAGFTVISNTAGMPTAFTATFGTGKPVIGILGEFDALPGVAQEAVPELKPIPGQVAGHACGHHLFGVASAAAAIAVKDWLIANKKPGTIRFYGTPAEEGGSGKVYMVRDGLFKDVDVVIHWHPSMSNSASYGSTLANKTGKFRFYGVASHAAASPERGRSALDAVEAMDVMVNMLREHVPQETRIHYVITKGGEAPNVVPAFAEVYYYVRNPRRDNVKSIWERIERAAQGAAMGTDTRVEVEVTGGVHEILVNESLAKVMDANLRAVGGYTYSPEEKIFATKIQQTFTQGPLPPLESTQTIAPLKQYEGSASTDVGDVSWVVPTVGLGTATWVPGTAAHSWQAVAAGGTSIGYKGMMVAAKTLALTAIDLLTTPATLDAAWKEFRTRTGPDFKYEALIGERKPALDYRK